MSFKKIENKQSFLKAVIYGESGTGKTTLAEKIAIELAKQNGKKVYVLDSEGGIDFFANNFANEGIECFVSDEEITKDFDTFTNELKIAIQDNPSVIIIDSITDFGELCNQKYVYTKPATQQIASWGEAKRQWNTKVINVLKDAMCHVIVLGRETSGIKMEKGNDGKLGISHTNDTKIKSGLEIDYQLNLLINMERVVNKDNTQVRIASILKDRANQIDGMQFTNPTFKDIQPHFEGLQALSENFKYVKDKISISSNLEELELVKEEIKQREFSEFELKNLRQFFANRKKEFGL